MKTFIAWNINGIRSLLKTTFLDELVTNEDPDVLCLGEIKMSLKYNDIDDEIKKRIPKYEYRYWNVSSAKKGYSGTCIFSKKKPENVYYGLKYNDTQIDYEGRVITLEFKKYYLVHVYTPNSGVALERLKFRTETWDIAFNNYINKLNKKVIVCGDLNVAHNEIDLKNPKTNKRTAGFTDEERQQFNNILNNNDLIDAFRYKNPDLIKYSYWSYMRKSREKDIGWRIDYFLLNNKSKNKIENCDILREYYGSDHAPIKLKLNI